MEEHLHSFTNQDNFITIENLFGNHLVYFNDINEISNTFTDDVKDMNSKSLAASTKTPTETGISLYCNEIVQSEEWFDMCTVATIWNDYLNEILL